MKKMWQQTKFGVGDVWKMMTVPTEGAQRLAEIFREIFALSETNKSNQSKSADVDEPSKAFDEQGEVPALKRKQTSDGPTQAGDHESLR